MHFIPAPICKPSIFWVGSLWHGAYTHVCNKLDEPTCLRKQMRIHIEPSTSHRFSPTSVLSSSRDHSDRKYTITRRAHSGLLEHMRSRKCEITRSVKTVHAGPDCIIAYNTATHKHGNDVLLFGDAGWAGLRCGTIESDAK